MSPSSSTSKFHWFTDCHLEAIFNMNTSTGNEQIEQLAEYNDKHRVVNAHGEVIYSSSIFIFISTSLTNSQENQQVIHILTVS